MYLFFIHILIVLLYFLLVLGKSECVEIPQQILLRFFT